MTEAGLPNPTTGGPRYELRDVNASRLVALATILCVTVVLTGAAVWTLMTHFAARQSLDMATSSRREPSTQGPSNVPGPRLQTSPGIDLSRKRAAEDALLNSYGWIDKQMGTVRIPIDRAMELFAQRSQPDVPGVSAVPTPASRKER